MVCDVGETRSMKVSETTGGTMRGASSRTRMRGGVEGSGFGRRGISANKEAEEGRLILGAAARTARRHPGSKKGEPCSIILGFTRMIFRSYCRPLRFPRQIQRRFALNQRFKLSTRHYKTNLSI